MTQVQSVADLRSLVFSIDQRRPKHSLIAFLLQRKTHLSLPRAHDPFNPILSYPMAPSAITPPQGVQQTSELTAAAITEKIAQTAPGLLKK